MPDSLDLKPVLTFLKQVKKNNNRVWFEAHRPAYELAKARFEVLVQALIDGLRPIEDLGDLQAKDCIMRIFRDIRFAKDKSPYRTNMGASIARGGKRHTRLPYYLHLEPGGSFIAGGLYMPEKPQLDRLRGMLAQDAGPLKAITGNRTFKRLFGDLRGEKLKVMPRGYPADHPEIELLKLKQFMAIHDFTDEEVLAPRFPTQALKVMAAMKPLLDYLNFAVM
jgi:uncharacterized protein (TIGR02453 family)